MRIEIPKGYSIYKAVEYAKLKCIETHHNYVTYVFNGIEMEVNVDSLEEDICMIYQLKCKIQRLEQTK